MATKERKGAGLVFDLPPLGGATSERTTPKTAVGLMADVIGGAQEKEAEISRLKEALQPYEGGLPVHRLDPNRITPSELANRLPESFEDKAFSQLVQEIREAGGNVQPIKVRPTQLPGFDYEVVFGHRRHRACLTLGLPVLAVIEPVSTQAMFLEMERENRERKNLSAYEQGLMYQRALDMGLYPSQRALADAIGRDAGFIGRARQVVGLPAPILEAFASRNDIQFLHGKPLMDAWAKNPKALSQAAQELKQAHEAGKKISANQVVKTLVAVADAGGGLHDATPPETSIQHQGREIGSLARKGKQMVLTLEANALNEQQWQELRDWIAGRLRHPG